MKIIKSITNCYNKMSNFGKVLIFVALLLIIVILFRSVRKTREGLSNQLTTTDTFTFVDGDNVYDDFYSEIYDYLVFNHVKNDYETSAIIGNCNTTEKSRIVDIGCGTGHHVNNFHENNLNITGVDISPAMIKRAKEIFPHLEENFQVGDALNNHLFQHNSLSHILCLYFTIYYMKDKMRFFYNCMDWLMPGGYLVVHLVDKYKFDPILPPGNPLYIVSPQKYAKERITKTKVTFNDFVYNANFKLAQDSNEALFDEKFKFNDGRVRKQEQKLYMEDVTTIANMAQEAGFLIHAQIDLVKCAYEYQYLYVFMKPA